jgi:hypothetical protein
MSTTTETSVCAASLHADLRDWLTRAQTKIRRSPIAPADLEELSALIGPGAKVRQRLLYLHTSSPSPRSLVVAMDKLDPVPGGADMELTPEPAFPYPSVWDAMCDGWQVVQFPEYSAPIPDREIDVQGYQFILQKLEVHRD